jgi:cytochrome c-type biogenesis protein CcmH/NrfF
MIVAVVVPGGAPGKAYEFAATKLLCDCGCNPQSIRECACGRAEELRVSLAKDATAGQSGEAIVAAYVAKNGPKILVAPPASGFNLIAWTGPAVGVLAAALMIALMLRRWRRESAEHPQEPPPPPTVGDDVYLSRLRKEIEEGR